MYPEDPDAPDYIDCDCAIHLAPMDTRDWEVFKSLDHYNPGNWYHSCYHWMEELIDVEQATEIAVPLGDGRVTERLTLHGNEFPWPIPLMNGQHQLMLVLRQWVESDPDAQFRRLLDALPAWQAAVQSLREMHERSLAQGRSGELAAPGHCEATTGTVRPMLQWHGLPATQGTAQYMGWLVRGDDEPAPAPTRGLLVTSLCLSPIDPDGPAHGQVVSQVVSVSAWVNDALRRRAEQAAADHARWWARMPQGYVPKMDLRQLNRRVPDEIREAVLRHLAGEITRSEVDRIAIEREREELGRELHHLEEQQVRRRVSERVRWQQKREFEEFLSGKPTRRLPEPE